MGLAENVEPLSGYFPLQNIVLTPDMLDSSRQSLRGLYLLDLLERLYRLNLSLIWYFPVIKCVPLKSAAYEATIFQRGTANRNASSITVLHTIMVLPLLGKSIHNYQHRQLVVNSNGNGVRYIHQVTSLQLNLGMLAANNIRQQQGFNLSTKAIFESILQPP